MLRNVNGRVIRDLYERVAFDRRCTLLTADQFAAITDEVRATLDATPVGGVTSASWMTPGPDWAGTPFQAIYDRVHPGDYARAGMFVGKLVKLLVIQHPANWRNAKKARHADDPDGVQMTLYWRES